MNNKITKILTNFLLLGTFILTYFLDLTGLALHQYIGIGAGVFMLLHIITHAKWIGQVSSRFFQNLNGKIRFYYLVDLVLFILISTMIISGVLISTWLTINFDIYPFIRDIHIISSIAGLALLTVKLVYHWKFFANLFKRKTNRRQAGSPSTERATAPVRAYSRRDALKTIGAVSAIGIFGLYKSVSAMLRNYENAQVLPDPEVKTAQVNPTTQPTALASESSAIAAEPAVESQGGGRQRRRGQDKPASTSSSDENLLSATPQTPQSNIPAIQSEPTAVPETQNCVIRCPRGCAFPGECGHYIDENHNKLCDLGECLVV